MKSSSTQVNGHQPEKGKRRKDKKKTDIRWNSAIFFQVGLIVALLTSVFAMDLKIEKELDHPDPFGIKIEEPVLITNFVIDEPKPKSVQKSKPVAKLERPPVKQVVITDIIQKVDNNVEISKMNLVVATTVPDKPKVTTLVSDPTPAKPEGPRNVRNVEFAPVFPGCESLNTNAERVACMSSKIKAFVSRKFRTSVADDDTTGQQRISVQFKIDKNGKVAEVMARAKDKALEREAQRIINKLPPMTPGMQGDVSVDVLYMLPITFVMEN